MRALRLHDVKDLRIDEIPEPVCKDHQIKIAPRYIGICGSDLHSYHHLTGIPPANAPHPLTNETLPVVVGHEFSGVVTEVGSTASSTSDLKPGDHVVAMPTLVCGTCQSCKDGLINCCYKMGFLGISGGGGGIAERVCVDAAFCFKVPETIGLDVAALVEPIAVAWHACRVAEEGMKKGEGLKETLVMGAGPIGLAVILCLKARGTEVIVCAEVEEGRRRFAESFGATVVLDPGADDVVSKTKELCGGGVGPRVVFDCAGVSASLTTAALAVRTRGVVVNVAVWGKAAPFNPDVLVFGEKMIRNTLAYTPKDYQEVISAISSGHLNPAKMITSKIAMDRVVEDGYRALIEGKNVHVKILVDLKEVK